MKKRKVEVDARANEAEEKLKQGQPEEALRLCRELLEDEYDLSEERVKKLYRQIADHYRSKGENEKAEEILSELSDKFPQ